MAPGSQFCKVKFVPISICKRKLQWTPVTFLSCGFPVDRCTERIPNYSSANHEGAIAWGNFIKSMIKANQ